MSEKEEVFTTRVRKATRKIHSVSDALVNAKFAISLRDETVWGGGLFVFYHIFGFLEDAKERLNMPDYNKLFVNKIVYRKSQFEEDLKHYLGDDWQQIPKTQALHNYLKHLQDLEKDNPMMLMAYVYHLYLGLLSGGQILSKKRRMFGDKNATNTYTDRVTDFNQVDIPSLKNDFRKAMNEISEKWTVEQKDAFIEESNRVFVLNNSVVNAIGGQNQVIKELLYKASAVVAVVAGVIVAYKLVK